MLTFKILFQEYLQCLQFTHYCKAGRGIFQNSLNLTRLLQADRQQHCQTRDGNWRWEWSHRSKARLTRRDWAHSPYPNTAGVCLHPQLHQWKTPSFSHKHCSAILRCDQMQTQVSKRVLAEKGFWRCQYAALHFVAPFPTNVFSELNHIQPQPTQLTTADKTDLVFFAIYKNKTHFKFACKLGFSSSVQATRTAGIYPHFNEAKY